MKKAHVVPAHRKGYKQCLENSRSVFLLISLRKNTRIFNEMLRFFILNNLVSSNQSGFSPSDSCINQILSTTHEE